MLRAAAEVHHVVHHVAVHVVHALEKGLGFLLGGFVFPGGSGPRCQGSSVSGVKAGLSLGFRV